MKSARWDLILAVEGAWRDLVFAVEGARRDLIPAVEDSWRDLVSTEMGFFGCGLVDCRRHGGCSIMFFHGLAGFDVH